MPTCFTLLLFFCCQIFVPCHSRPKEDAPAARSKRAFDINLEEIPEEAREEIEYFITNCGKSYDLSNYAPASDDPSYDKEGQGLSFGLPFLAEGKYLTGFECTNYILGEDGCRPMFQCSTLDIRQLDPDCTKEFIEVSDGLGGLERYCGRAGPTKWMESTKPSYDLYLRYVISNSTDFDRPYGGIVCAAFCQPEGDQKKPSDPIPRPLARNAKRIFDTKCFCGIGKSGRVVGGADVFLNEFPWQTAMVVKNTRYIRCGASLLNDLYVITAAHCVIEGTELISPKEIDVLFHVNLLDQFLLKGWSNVSLGQVGSIQAPGWNMEKKTDEAEGTIRRAVKSIIVHPNYNLKTMDYDVAILKLKKRVNLHDPKSPVVPVCLPPNLMPESEIKGKTVTVVGWGLADEAAKGSTRLLQKLDMPYYSEEECVQITGGKFTERMLCAGHKEGKRDACTGDSGGPLIMRRVQNKLTQFLQVGIVSYGEGCARENQLGAYTRVSVIIPWILHVTPLANWCLEEPTKEMSEMKNAPSTTTSAPLMLAVCTNNKDGSPKCLNIFDKS